MSEPIRNYGDALRYLYGFADYERNKPRARDGFHLEAVRALLAALGNPHERLRAVHVAGTKGKGSTAAMISNTLVAGGNRVGFYSSPHLNTHRERYRLDGEPVSEAGLTQLLREVQPVVEKVRTGYPLTTYEVTTALAFELFARERVDWAVVEVGLGGRLDATNVITPELSVITSISVDHAEVLGDTLTAIAGEKAGIMKPGVPVVIASQPDEAARTLLASAAAVSAPALVVPDLIHAVNRTQTSGPWQEFVLDTNLALADGTLGGFTVSLGLLGHHQVENALTTVVTAAELASAGLPLRREHLARGLANVSWPGRFEVAEYGGTTFVLDGAHNPYSMGKLLETLDEVFPACKVAFVFGTGVDHDAAGMLGLLRDRQLILCKSSHPRALGVSRLTQLADLLVVTYRVAESVPNALSMALDLPNADVIVVCGSLFPVGEARLHLGLTEMADPVTS